ncbi:MAG: hypothetical protein QM769_08490 [Pseudoxanthomonas sp.]
MLSPSLAQVGRLAQVLAIPAHLLLSAERTSAEETGDGLAFQLSSLAPPHRAFVARFIRDYAALHGELARGEAMKRPGGSRRKA